MTSPSESTEPLKGIFTRDSKRWYINIKQPDRVEVVPLPEGAGGTVETLKSLLAQEYSRGVSDAIKALPEDKQSPIGVIPAKPDASGGYELKTGGEVHQHHLVKTWGYNQALAEARTNITKLKEPSND